jgi:hypothetical protein
MGEKVFRTKVIMDNGKEYEFDEKPDEFINKIYDPVTGKIRSGFINGEDFSICTDHISSIRNIEIRTEDKDKLEKLELQFKKNMRNNKKANHFDK